MSGVSIASCDEASKPALDAVHKQLGLIKAQLRPEEIGLNCNGAPGEATTNAAA